MKIRDLINTLEEFSNHCGDDIEVKAFDGDTEEFEPITGFVIDPNNGILIYTDKD